MHLIRYFDYLCYNLGMAEEELVEQKPLSKREQKKLAKQEKKAKKKEQKEADRAYEKSHPLRKRKIAAWIVELVGLLVAMVPAVVIIGVFLIALFAYIWGAILFILLAFGFILFGLGYFIYASTTNEPSPEGYFAIATNVFEWANRLVEWLNKLNGWFLTIFSGISLVLEIVGFVLLMTSLSACSKKHKVAYIILMSLIMALSIGILVYGLTKVIPH